MLRLRHRRAARAPRASPQRRRSTAIAALPLCAAFLWGALLAQPRPAFAAVTTLSSQEGYGLLRTLLEGAERQRRKAARQLVRAGDPSLVPGLVDALFYVPAEARGELLEVLRQLAGEDPGSGYYDWVELVGRRRDLEPKEGYLEWKVSLLTKIDPEYRKLLYPGAPHRVRLEEIVWGGARVDQIPALTDPPTVPAAEASAIADDEKVFGVAFGGEHRAYPLRYASWHEMVNDVVGGQPLTLSY